MPYEVHDLHVERTPLLVVRRRARQRELATVVPQACGVVWEFARRSGVASTGRHVAMYLSGEIDLEVGVEVGADAKGGGEVVLSATPAGRVATTTHWGSYAALHAAHQAILDWCQAHHRHLAGPSWEVYGHWTDEPAKVRTDIFYLLSPDGGPAS